MDDRAAKWEAHRKQWLSGNSEQKLINADHLFDRSLSPLIGRSVDQSQVYFNRDLPSHDQARMEEFMEILRSRRRPYGHFEGYYQLQDVID